MKQNTFWLVGKYYISQNDHDNLYEAVYSR